MESLEPRSIALEVVREDLEIDSNGLETVSRPDGVARPKLELTS